MYFSNFSTEEFCGVPLLFLLKGFHSPTFPPLQAKSEGGMKQKADGQPLRHGGHKSQKSQLKMSLKSDHNMRK